MLRVSNLQKAFSNKTVIKNVSFTVKPGEIVGLLGPNGAGKTTTFNMVTGIVEPDSGNIFYNDIHIKQNMLDYKKNIGFVSDSSPLYENLTGREFVEFLSKLWKVEKRTYKKRTEELAERFRMHEKLDDFIKTYSNGMKQKIYLIGILIYQPRLLILDEPFNALDPTSIKEMKDFFFSYVKEGNSIIFSSHILDIVESVCTRLVILNKGQVIVDQPIEDFVGEQRTEVKSNLESSFLKVTENHMNHH